MAEKNNKEDRKPIQFYMSIEKYGEIEEYSKIAGTTKSEFIRQAVYDKILRIKNPEMFEAKGLNGETKTNIHQILESIIGDNRKTDLLIEKMDLVLDIVRNLDIIGKRVEKDELSEIDEKLSNLLSKGKTMSLVKLTNELKTDEDTIIKALSLKDDKGKAKYIADINGRFKRNV